MTTVLSVCNQKGGVGKTTTSVNLSSALAKNKKKIILVDLDPQGNATMGSGINKNKLSSTIADLLLSEVESFRDILLHSDEGYDLLPANQTLTYAELKLLEGEEMCFFDFYQIQNKKLFSKKHNLYFPISPLSHSVFLKIRKKIYND